jgi:hypothetical protein
VDGTNPRDPLLRRLSLSSVDFPRFKLDFLIQEARKSISISHFHQFPIQNSDLRINNQPEVAVGVPQS